jgi:hypothetical protein
MSSGISLRTLRDRAACGRVVHHATPEWTITSNEPLEALLHCPLLSRTLPGRLGTHFYPEDAVFAMRHVRCTRRAHWETTLAAEMSSRRETTDTVVHVTAERLPEATAHSASDGSDNDMDEEDALDEDAEDDGASTVMEEAEADDPDVDDEPSVFSDN